MSTFFNDILTSITERGRSLIDFSGRERTGGKAGFDELFEQLLSERGEASGMAIAREIFERYAQLDATGRHDVIDIIADRFGVDLEAARVAAERFLDEHSDAAGRDLSEASEPRRQELFRRLNLAPDGTAQLVAMRTDLLKGLRENPDWAGTNADFIHLFGSWFNRGFLVLRRIDWQTPAAILEKIIKYEAVHAIHGWEDLRRRIDPPDRRLYAFFHPRLSDDPLIFVEVALTTEIPTAIPPILADGREPIDPRKATTATFYSISNCQSGLAGVSFGSFLIKQVVEELSRELHGLKTYVTLSPVPNFVTWLKGQTDPEADGEDRVLNEAEREVAARAIAAAENGEAPSNEDEGALTQIAAWYFLNARDRKGRPFDPVARFHLGNGALLERVNWAGDPSPRGLKQSLGIMVNYRYEPDEIEANHEAFVKEDRIVAAPRVHRLARGRNAARDLVAG
ncbi:MAG: malonyl-CoA decarboxylase [Tepidamorphaceae bacterium]|nr:malonyl-CoA decarboxylase [Rhodobiaceae bacterium]MCC0048388.1 malonyl-CoA decarboxylase [Rhodobiaceae bacterium]